VGAYGCDVGKISHEVCKELKVVEYPNFRVLGKDFRMDFQFSITRISEQLVAFTEKARMMYDDKTNLMHLTPEALQQPSFEEELQLVMFVGPNCNLCDLTSSLLPSGARRLKGLASVWLASCEELWEQEQEEVSREDCTGSDHEGSCSNSDAPPAGLCTSEYVAAVPSLLFYKHGSGSGTGQSIAPKGGFMDLRDAEVVLHTAVVMLETLFGNGSTAIVPEDPDDPVCPGGGGPAPQPPDPATAAAAAQLLEGESPPKAIDGSRSEPPRPKKPKKLKGKQREVWDLAAAQRGRHSGAGNIPAGIQAAFTAAPQQIGGGPFTPA
ncbi:hypothetical protein CYMTET_33685, partial [Cymbomonas tetramitiformis]